ncbi:MAG: ribosome biogenesis GTPase Der [Alphaproteobacteria bacterium]|nr:ribosome biogenesis GTPase Der [Alphaproteobacteria bacterium]
MITVSIVGRPNVGKSTLFNRLTKFHKAIIHNYPGITRDYKEAQGELGDISFKVIDTAGLYTASKLNDLEKQINSKTEAAIKRSDIVLFMVDGKEGFHSEDANISKFIRKKNTPIMLLVNKSDSKLTDENLDDFFKLGHENICKISAEHRTGLASVYEMLSELSKDDSEEEEDDDRKKLRLSISGRPNVGKSTLINSLINEDRLLTGDVPGITRDSVSVKINHKDYEIEIVDTAGVRKKRNIGKDSLEQLFVRKTLDSLFSSDVVVLMVDINYLLENQDLKIANLISDRGKPIILVINKVDTIRNTKVLKEVKEEIAYLINKKLSDIKTLPVIYISALKKSNINQILDQALKQYELWYKKIPSSQLNKWLESAMEEHQPPMSNSGTRIKIKYINQISCGPSVFQLFVNRPEELPERYMYYLTAHLRDSFSLEGVPIKLVKAKGKNPFTDKK